MACQYSSKFHLVACAKLDILSALKFTFATISDNEKNQYLTAFADPEATLDNPKFPEFAIAMNTVTLNNEQVPIYELHVNHSKPNAILLLIESRAITHHYSKLCFIPYHWQYQDQQTYLALICKQHTFLKNHHNIPLAGISKTWLTHSVLWNGLITTPDTVLCQIPGVTAFDITTWIHDLGKINLSTNYLYYNDVCKWIKTHLTCLFTNMPQMKPWKIALFPPLSIWVQPKPNNKQLINTNQTALPITTTQPLYATQTFVQELLCHELHDICSEMEEVQDRIAALNEDLTTLHNLANASIRSWSGLDIWKGPRWVKLPLVREELNCSCCSIAVT